MQRRDALIAPVLLGASFPGRPQAPAKVWRLGILSLSVQKADLGTLQALRELGYEEGRNLAVDFRFAQGRVGLLPGLAAELVAAKPDVLLAPLNVDAAVLKLATSSIPIVMLYVVNPVEIGLVESLARPGGNLTGTTFNVPDMGGKVTQLMHETVPHAASIAWLSEPDYPGNRLFVESIRRAATTMGLRISFLDVRAAADLDVAFTNLKRDRPDVLCVATSGVLLEQLDRVIEFAALQRLPASYSTKQAVLKGGLLSYGGDTRAMALRNSSMIDKIFKGTKPSDIPVEQPAKFQLTINMKTARALGLVIPRSVLLQVTELIE